ncbi:putative membrane protein YahN [Rickettsiales endosymbiont of Trichoplax sp. H2]|nr:putative membrane protein YahN [Rickettsiales endosymbiont of Trichoplax sp. H2]
MSISTILLYIIALIQPGPSFLIICNNTLLYGRTIGLSTSLGVILGISIQSSIAIIFSNIFYKNYLFFKILKIICALIFIIFGIKNIFIFDNKLNKELAYTKKIKIYGYFLKGLLVEICNPLAFSFFLSIFSQTTHNKHYLILNLIYWIIICSIGAIWVFSLVFISSNHILISKFKKYNKLISIITGILLIFYALKFLFKNL